MGLGPPVCERCQVICDFARNLDRYCGPICGNDDPQDYAGLSDSRWNWLKENLKFLKFTLGK